MGAVTATTAVGIGAIIAGVVAGWNQVKNFVLGCRSLLLYNIRVDHQAVYILRKYLHALGKKPIGVTHALWQTTSAVKSAPQSVELSMLSVSTSPGAIYFVRGGWLTFVYSESFLYLRAPKTVAIHTLIKQAFDQHNSSVNRSNFFIHYPYGSRFKNADTATKTMNGPTPVVDNGADNIYDASICLNYHKDDIGHAKASSLDNLYLDSQMQEAVNDIRHWYNSRSWYEQHLISWRRGWVIYGPPGCGKTKFLRAVAEDLALPLNVFDLATMTNADFMAAVRINTGIMLFEDFDTIFEGRVNKTDTIQDRGITFDCFLNTLDGVNSNTGKFFVITTNNLECLDPAIAGTTATRPGRIDRVFKFQHLPEEGKRWMTNKILGDWDSSKWQDLLQDTTPVSGAVFQNTCCQRAMDLYWAETTDN